LLQGRVGKDRLTLLADICDALDLHIALVPAIDADQSRQQGKTKAALRNIFDELFVDLSDAG
jgi:hypothetical protein